MQIHMILFLKVATVVILSIILATYRVSDALVYQKCQFISQFQEKKRIWLRQNSQSKRTVFMATEQIW